MAFDYTKDILSQHFSTMVLKMVGMKYSSDIVICVSEYYATSQSLDNRIFNYHH